MCDLKCYLCLKPANEPPDEFKSVLTNLTHFFNTFQPFSSNCIQLNKLIFCQSCWIFLIRLRQFDHAKRIKKETYDAKKALLSSKILRARQSLVNSRNLTCCQDSDVRSSANTDNDDNNSNASGQSVDGDIAEPISCSLNNTDESDNESLETCENTKINTNTSNVSDPTSSANKEPTTVTSSGGTCESDSEPESDKRKTLVDNEQISASLPEKEPTEMTSTDTSEAESDWEPTKRKTRVRVSTSATLQEQEPTELTSTDTSDPESDWEPAKRKTRVRVSTSTSSKDKEPAEVTSGSEAWPPKGIVIPADTPSVKRVPNSTKFTYKGEFQFEGTDFGFKCSSCPFVTKFQPSGPRKSAWYNILVHIREWHLDPERLAAKKNSMPQTSTVEVAPNQFLHGGVPFKKLENDEYECGVCGFRPVVNSRKPNYNMLRHIFYKHLQVSGAYICEVCGSKLKTRESLRKHKEIHKELMEDQLFVCSVCGKKFKSKDKLHSHTKKVHGGEDVKKNLCEVCGKRFNTAPELASHKFSHTGVRTFKCPECGKMFGSYAALYTHQHRHTGKKFTCDICGMQFTQHYSVKRHKMTAHSQ